MRDTIKSIMLALQLLFISCLGHIVASPLQAQNHDAEFIPGNPIKQWLEWETRSNLIEFVKPRNQQAIAYTLVNSMLVQVDIASYAPDYVRKMIYKTPNKVIIPSHPNNTYFWATPWSYVPSKDKLTAHYTASRSMVIEVPGGQHLVSYKLPTDYISSRPDRNISKLDLKKSIIISRRRSDLIHSIDQKLGAERSMSVMLDVAAIKFKLNGNGVVMRSLEAMKPGHHYLPAFALPYAGKDIAKLLDIPFHILFEEVYAADLGRAKANMLLRYALQMYTPNAQNMLIEFDANYVPTRRILFRDIGDSRFVDNVAINHSPEVKKAFAQEVISGFRSDDGLYPYWTNSAMHFEKGGIRSETISNWGRAHDLAYAETILTELKLEHHLRHINETLPWDKGNGHNRGRSKLIERLEEILFSEEGKQAIRTYQAKVNLHGCWAKGLKQGLL